MEIPTLRHRATTQQKDSPFPAAEGVFVVRTMSEKGSRERESEDIRALVLMKMPGA